MKKLTLKSVMNESLSSANKNYPKILIASVLQYSLFLVTFLLTNSYFISFAVWGLFLVNQTAFLSNVEENKFEDLFKFNKKFIVPLALSLISVLFIGVGFALLIFPAIILFVNFLFAFDYAKDGESVENSLKLSRECAKGYRGKIFWISMVYFLIILLSAGFGVLLTFVLSLLIPALSAIYVYVGLFIGISIYLIFIAPIQIMTVSKMKELILRHKLEKELEDKKAEEEKPETTEAEENGEYGEGKKPEEKLDDRNEETTTDYIF